KACVLPENPASYRVVRTKSYLFNKAGNCLTGLFNVSKNIQHVNITNLHGRDLISEVDILGNEITLRPWQVMWIK
ncbi:hypothetical protein, partial [Escherichia coli]|uniref:hypothetical protein n=1 Tax=Escherichia coli TaxID=562 RepID=UPI001FCEA839